MTHAPEIFERHASDYEGARRLMIPPYDAFYGAAIAALELAGRPLRNVLDLGAGTGLLARAVAASNPDAKLTLLDGSAAMLEQARAAIGDAATYVVADFADALPAGPWDAVVSALAIHHSEDDVKRALFRRVHDALGAGGLFVNAEHVSGPTALFENANQAWHERRAAELGATPAEWAAGVERMRADRRAPVEQQLGWLRDAGFADVDCVFKDHGFAVLVGRRAP
ncbi:MAG TPA: methyltransferase domain-containing protein [Solirubrobacteraceae bacterium]|jgi:tRNA (cmo5U34)-methyltransferase|nr:methyltransferase domain-containing protein [Solirubrobacteraceae bacterium]